MEGWQIALVLKPFMLLLMFAPGAALVYLMRVRLRESKLKRLLLFSWRV